DSTFPKTVGVFIHKSPEQVTDVLRETGLNFAQLHSEETAADLASLNGRAFKAIQPANLDEALAGADTFAVYGPESGPQILIDAYDVNEYGGTGKRADWNAAATVAETYPRILLAGGLTPDNVADAVRKVRPWGVDVASGTERAPGLKDHEKVRAFVQAAKTVE
ncbi:MAG: phosphoribosylanthranilate isomerase, partial [Chloroflexota bacterium]